MIWWKQKRWLVTVAVLSAVAALLIFLFWPRTDELARWKVAMQAKGENFTLTEVAPKFSPAARQWAHDFKAAVDGIATSPVPPGGIFLMETTTAVRARVAWRQPFPVPEPQTNQTWAELVRQFERSSNSLAQLHGLLRQFPEGNPSDYSNLRDAEGVDLSARRKASHTLAAGVVMELHRGALDAALTNLLLLNTLALPVGGEGPLLEQMIRVGIAALGTSATWEALQARGWTDQSLATLDAAWARIRFLEQMERCFVTERAWIAANYDYARTNVSGRSKTFGGPAGGLKQLFEDRIHGPVWQKAWSKTDELRYLRAMQSIMETFRHGVTNRSWQAMSASLRVADQSKATNRMVDLIRYPFSALAMPNCSKAIAYLLKQETRVQMARAAVAIERHRLRHGRAPESLARLVPEFLPAPPHDYMTGQPLRYAPQPDGGFTLHSAGEDGRDDGGAGDDLVWPRAEPAGGR